MKPLAKVIYKVLEVLLLNTPIERPEWEMMRLIAWECNDVGLHGGLKKLLPFVKVVPRRLANRDDFMKWVRMYTRHCGSQLFTEE